MNKQFALLVALILVLGVGAVWKESTKVTPVVVVTSFEECVAAGNPVMESYPRQCRQGDQSFTENIGGELGKADLIRVDSPRPNQVVSSPLAISGQARGTWYFEASFPVVLTDWDGKIIAQGIAQAKSDWMTTEFVPFEAKLTFAVEKNIYSYKGTLILRKDNPSGLPEHDDALEIPIMFAAPTAVTPPPPKPIACTADAKICPDGSAVGRTGPNCQFAPCPSVKPQPTMQCLKDSDCPSSKYMCEETAGTGTACSSTDPSCVPTHTTTAGQCKLRQGNTCSVNADCASGNLCRKNICTSPIGKSCSSTSDTSCPADFECVQSCGLPVARENDSPAPFFCQLKGYNRTCPICLAKDTLIDTPSGLVAVQDLKSGDSVWTVTKSGERVQGTVQQASKTAVPSDHQMVNLLLLDGRTMLVSPGHPTTNGRTVADLVRGDLYDGTIVTSTDRVAYKEGYTYDLLPSGETGFYFANGILMDSTLRVH